MSHAAPIDAGRLRVLIAHSFYRLAGGEDRYVSQQVELLGDLHTVRLLGTKNEDLLGGVRAARRMIYSTSILGEVESEISKFRPDVMHLHNVYPGLGPAVHIAASKQRVPLVMTVHNQRLRCPNGLMFTEGLLCRRCESGNHLNAIIHPCFPGKSQSLVYATALWFHRFVLALEEKISLFIAPSAFMVEQLSRWGIPTKKIRLIRNFTSVPPPPDREPGAYGLYIGRLSAEKGVGFLLTALRQAGDPPFRIVGEGPMSGELRAMADELGLKNTTFLGQLDRNEVQSQLTSCRFVTLPSLCYENAPLAALEAMAAGRPLLVTQLGGLPELAGNDRGLTCRPADVQGLGECIARLTDDTALCVETGLAGYRFAAKELTPQVHLSQLGSAYASVI